ncbi:glycoside hydrolase family 6 protein [Geodermatophilus sp. SYSU D00758]
MRRTSRRSLRALALATAAVGAVACGGAAASDDGRGRGAPADPAAAAVERDRLPGRLWVNPEGHGPRAVRQALEEGRTADAETLAPFAEQPTATWVATPENPYPAVLEVSEAAAAEDRVPVLVAYNIPGRDCGSYSAGGAADVDGYLSWIGSFAAALGDRPAVVVLEPDSVAHALVGCAGVDPAARFELLAQAVAILDRQPGARVYVDAGNAGWIQDLPALAEALRRSGVDRAEGFALNVANFETTEASAEYGLALSRQLEEGAPPGTPAAHFVIDTSRNGAGPVPETGSDEDRWCNPEGRLLGESPTTDPDLERVDALLWVKQPGDSDGTCRGGPPAGRWWPEAAAELAGG